MAASTPSSSAACSNCSAVGTPWCHAGLFSAKLTPLPFHGVRNHACRLAGLQRNARNAPATRSCRAHPLPRPRSRTPATSPPADPCGSSSPSSRPAASDCDRRSPPGFQAVMLARHRRFPVRALLQFAIAGQHKRPPGLARIRAASAHPTAIGSPCPSGPVFASTPGTLLRSGCPFNAESGSMKLRNCASGKNPRSASTEYSAAAQWPLDKMKRSRSGHPGCSGCTFSTPPRTTRPECLPRKDRRPYAQAAHDASSTSRRSVFDLPDASARKLWPGRLRPAQNICRDGSART